MPYQTRAIVQSVVLAVCLLALFRPALSGAKNAYWELPPTLPPDEYGNIIINRTSERNKEKPVAFSHWIHRQKHTCRVCHFELEFNMKVNTTEITEAANKAGKFCGACHNNKEIFGKVLFGHTEPNCSKCHNNDRGAGKKKFQDLAKFPKTAYGNNIDWVKALDLKLITPVHTRSIPPTDMSFQKELKLEAEWSNIPPAVFPHKAHIAWLDCNNCHPDIFNIKKKTTKHFVMTRILKGEFCGVCHLTVAFPMDDCKRCHPSKTK